MGLIQNMLFTHIFIGDGPLSVNSTHNIFHPPTLTLLHTLSLVGLSASAIPVSYSQRMCHWLYLTVSYWTHAPQEATQLFRQQLKVNWSFLGLWCCGISVRAPSASLVKEGKVHTHSNRREEERVLCLCGWVKLLLLSIPVDYFLLQEEQTKGDSLVYN